MAYRVYNRFRNNKYIKDHGRQQLHEMARFINTELIDGIIKRLHTPVDMFQH